MASMPHTISFGDAENSLQAHTINGSVEFHLQPELENTLLDRLPHAQDAPFNSYAKQHERTCLADTRVGLLDEIHGWAEGQDERCIFWLRGMAGTGKSTIARTVAHRYYDKQRLAASFFFSRGGGDVGHAGKFVTSIAVQLARSVPAVRQHICNAVKGHGDVASQSLRDQWHHLVLRPLSKLHEVGQYVVVVDALDECDNDDNVEFIVRLLAEARSLERVRLRVFLTSRPVELIRHGFGQIADAEHKDFVLHDISLGIVNHDITLFFKYQLDVIAKRCHLPDDWPGAEDIRRLVQSANGLFIWAATACRYIQEGSALVADRLKDVLKDSSLTENLSDDDSSEYSNASNHRAASPEQHLDSLYFTVLKRPIQRLGKRERKKWYNLIREILGAIVLLGSPLSAFSVARLLSVRANDVHRTLCELHSILDVPREPMRQVRLHHPSLRDFLLDKKRCNDNFWVDERSTHEKLASCCLKLMSAPHGLRQDICNLSEPGICRSKIVESRITTYLPPELQYACRYFVDHLERSQHGVKDGDATHHFLKKHFLHWLEAMSLIRETNQCTRLIETLCTLVRSPSTTLFSFLQDARRFTLRFQYILEEAPLQIYTSALIFSPEESIVRRAFMTEMPGWVKLLSKREDAWNACRSTLEGHTDSINAIAFSPDGQLVASASYDRTVRLWETATGACCSTLEGHTGYINAIAFSPDGQLVASASYDRTVRLWETATGACCSTLEGHTSSINAIAFSPDGQLVASASYDMTVRLWETATGACCSTLEGHTGYIRAIAFSPDGQLVASASYDRTVRLWETATGACCTTLEGHTGYIRAIAFSPDGQLVASASYDRTVRLWETATGACCTTLEGHTNSINAIAFSPDGQYLHTDRGALPLPSPFFLSLPLQCPQSSCIFVQDQWVLSNKQRLLWLPFEYRPSCSAVYKDMVCLGHNISGRLTLLVICGV